MGRAPAARDRAAAPRAAGPADAWRALAALGDVALLLDAEGRIEDAAFASPTLRRDLGGIALGRPWSGLVAPDSIAAVEALLRDAGAAPTWRLVRHRGAGDDPVPLLAATLGLDGSRRILALGRDLLGYDLTGLALSQEMPVLLAHAAASLRRGATPESFCLDQVAPAARRLGDLWAADRCSFVDVADAVARLRRVVDDLRPASPEGAPRILLLPAPGEAHHLGLDILALVFARAGWRVVRDGAEAGLARVRREHVDVVGLSASGAARVPGLSATIRALRRASVNPALRVLAGGPAFAARPGLAASVGADAGAADARAAVPMAEALLPPGRAALRAGTHGAGGGSGHSPGCDPAPGGEGT